jgi:chemotaxis protein CheY-P-specific phosphatase CheC
MEIKIVRIKFLVPFSLLFNVNSTSLKKINTIFRIILVALEVIFHKGFGMKAINRIRTIQAIDIMELLGSKIENKLVII